MNDNLSVVILAAGRGTRMKSRKAKVLHEAGGKPLIAHVVDNALEVARADRICVVVGYQADQVRSAVGGRGVGFALQSEQRGTGHGVLSARAAMPDEEGRVVVLYGDCPLLGPDTLRRLIADQRESGAAATLISTELDDPTGYGRIVRDDTGAVRAIVEEKAASAAEKAIREINSGIYCFRADLLWMRLASLGPNPVSGEYYLTDVIAELDQAGDRAAALRLPNSAELLGINNRIELAEADRILGERTVRRLMLDGVTIRKPETVTIDATVTIGSDTVIEPFAQIRGDTRIGESCRVGTAAILEDAILDDEVVVDSFTIVRHSRLERGAVVGPFARLRVDNHVEAGAHVGNFVELKKTRLGAGAKAQHLAYLGDSTIGEGVNIGAGTITCNYDGDRKHTTRIGRGAFVGSNSTLVAPVEIGDDSYLAAGSVITDSVPPGSLALGRARQVVKEGWARKRRAAAPVEKVP